MSFYRSTGTRSQTNMGAAAHDDVDGKHYKPSHLRPRGGPGGKSGRIVPFLFALMALGYIGLIYHFKSQGHARDLETTQAVRTLQEKLDGLKEKMQQEVKAQRDKAKEKEAALEQAHAALQEKGRLLEERQAALAKANEKLGKVEARLSEEALVLALKKQDAIFNHLRWGEGPARIVLELPDHREVELETAPFDLMPHAIHWFLTLVETGYWDGCHIVRNAHHVIQLNCNGRAQRPELKALHPSVVFQEFHPDFHHEADTVGIAGRPGGPDWYINLMENKRSHGPGGQGPEADPCFGRIVRGKEHVEHYHKTLGNEFLPQEEYVEIKRAYIVNKHDAAHAAAGADAGAAAHAAAAPAQAH